MLHLLDVPEVTCVWSFGFSSLFHMFAYAEMWWEIWGGTSCTPTSLLAGFVVCVLTLHCYIWSGLSESLWQSVWQYTWAVYWVGSCGQYPDGVKERTESVLGHGIDDERALWSEPHIYVIWWRMGVSILLTFHATHRHQAYLVVDGFRFHQPSMPRIPNLFGGGSFVSIYPTSHLWYCGVTFSSAIFQMVDDCAFESNQPCQRVFWPLQSWIWLQVCAAMNEDGIHMPSISL